MAGPAHIILVRHGETVGESSIRYHGRNDVVLSRKGRDQAHDLRKSASFDLDRVISSPLARAWQTATILAPGCDIEIEEAFAEIDFGRWEGLTREEIAVLDPDLFEAWQSNRAEIEFPEGELKQVFRSRVQAGLKRLLALPVRSVLVVAHKGVVRGLAEGLTGSALPQAIPDLGEALGFRLQADGKWILKTDATGHPDPRGAPDD
ncbi:MAG: histidine phosphatase family protein [Myxococcota bacterium]|nr:histidine phosphatase family protein [Myxococcota bacterium]